MTIIIILVILVVLSSIVKHLVTRYKDKCSEEATLDYMLWQIRNTSSTLPNGFLLDDEGHLLDGKNYKPLS